MRPSLAPPQRAGCYKGSPSGYPPPPENPPGGSPWSLPKGMSFPWLSPRSGSVSGCYCLVDFPQMDVGLFLWLGWMVLPFVVMRHLEYARVFLSSDFLLGFVLPSF